MKYNIHVFVSEKHIRIGKRVQGDKSRSIYLDPISLAINDCLKVQYHAAVGKERPNVISLEYSDRDICQYMVYMTPKIVEFINKFDRGENVEPFVFLLPSVDEKMIKF